MPLPFEVINMLEFILNNEGEKPVWTYEGNPLSISIAGNTHFVRARDVRIEHIVHTPENPTDDRTTYVFKSANGQTIDDITLNQSWERQSYGLKRYESQSFPMEHCVLIPEDASVLSCLAILLPVEGERKDYQYIALTDYLERKNAAAPVS